MANTPTKFSKNSQAIDIIGTRSDTEQNIASTKAIQGESVLTRSYLSDKAAQAIVDAHNATRFPSPEWLGGRRL